MTYRAKMENGQVVFQDGIKPAEGVELRVDVVQTASTAQPPPQTKPTLSETLLSLAGMMDDPTLPEDGSINHDHYIYGTPKR